MTHSQNPRGEDLPLGDVALSRIEEVAGFTLSRSMCPVTTLIPIFIRFTGFTTPNIKSKGAIPPKAARIPAFWASAHPSVREPKSPSVPTWSWSPTRDGCRIVIQVPELVRISPLSFRHVLLHLNSDKLSVSTSVVICQAMFRLLFPRCLSNLYHYCLENDQAVIFNVTCHFGSWYPTAVSARNGSGRDDP